MTKANKKLIRQIVQFNIENNNLKKTISDLEDKLNESQTSVAILTAKLEYMKKIGKNVEFRFF